MLHQSFGYYEISMTNSNLLQSNVLWIDVSKYCFSSIGFSICFSRFDRDKTTNLKNIKLSFYKINFTTCSPLNRECLKNSKPRVFSLLSLHQCKCMKYRCQCATPASLLYQTIVFYYQKAVVSHVCVVMVMVGCIRQYTKN